MSKKNISIFIIVLIFILVGSWNVIAQKKSDQNDLQQIKADLEKLKSSQELKLQELEKLINKIESKLEKKEQEDELKKLLEEAAQLSIVKKKKEGGLGKKFRSGVRQQSGLNPNLSLSGDFFAAVSSSNNDFISKPSSYSYGNNGFDLREVEVSLIAPLDPFTRGKTHISFTENEITIEEAYLEWLNLPANLNLKMGLFNAEYGIVNRYHDHALPQFDRPKILVNMFSNASVGGFGIAGNFLLPTLLFADASNFDVSVIKGGNDNSFTSQGKYNLLYVAKFNNYYDINRDIYFEWSLSGVAGKNDSTNMSYVGNLGFTVKWAPVGRAKYRTIDWKTEILYSRRETATGNIDSKGFYTSLQNKLNARYWLSGRVGYSELPWDKNQHEWDITGCLDVWQSEFVFLRFQYQYSKREFTNYLNFQAPYPKDDHTLLFQVCWAMGPHKHEAY